MTVEPRAALDRLVAALEAHHHAVATRRSDDDPAVDDAYEVYEESLATVFGEVTPFYLAEEVDDDEDEEDDLDDIDFDDDLEDAEDAVEEDEPQPAQQR